ncbi:phage holin family protein [Solitalea koreensis]|nr:phage holin family protein [Solitalea koreensis]
MKPYFYLILLSVFCVSCLNELKLIKVNGHDPIPYEFSSSSFRTPDNNHLSLIVDENSIGSQPLTSDKSEVGLPEKNNSIKILSQVFHQNNSHKVISKAQPKPMEKISTKKAERIVKKAAAPPASKTNVIVGSILSVVGVIFIIGGVASLFSGTAGIALVVLGVIFSLIGAVLVFKGASSRKK